MQTLDLVFWTALVGLTPACITERYVEAIIAEHGVTWIPETTGTTVAAETIAGSSPGSATDETTTTGSSGDVSAADHTGTTAAATDETGVGTVSGSTTEPPPSCGDGEMAGEEECDDANTNDQDGCRSDCTRAWLVFATSEPKLKGDDIKGIVGADYQCRHRAAQMFLDNADRYRAWISTSTVQAVDRLYHARGPYVLVNGLQVAANWQALVSGQLEHAIDVDEMSQTVTAPVWTGTLPSGHRSPSSGFCSDWTSNDLDENAVFGDSTAIDGTWTTVASSHCAGDAALYCFEQP